jgi:hypothetical protein
MARKSLAVEPGMAAIAPDVGGAVMTPALPAAPAAAPAPASTAAAGKPPSAATAAGSAAAPAELVAPAIIYVGELGMLVDEDQLASALDRAIDLAESVGGFLGTRTDTTVEIRVPAPRFREAMRKLEALGQVTRRSVSAQDVSAEIHDAEVRITNLRATRKRLEEFLARASSIPDTLTVERELERVALEIDQLEGRLRFLRTHASYSTIRVVVAPRPRAAVVAHGPAPRRLPIPRLPIAWLDDVGAARLLALE